MSEPLESKDRGEDPYRSHGYFRPFDTRRILKRFEEQNVRFQIADASGVERWDTKFPRYGLSIVPPLLLRSNRIEIFVHLEDAKKAQQIIDQRTRIT